MKVYTAPEFVDEHLLMGRISVFLSGGITGCRKWQDDAITELGSFPNTALDGLKSLVVFNPRRYEFVNDSVNAIAQIKWEHRCLETCDIFSVFFLASDSVQPITLYELGKYAGKKPTVVTIESGYKRELDVITQMALDGIYCSVHSSYEEAIIEHARKIAILAAALKETETDND